MKNTFLLLCAMLAMLVMSCATSKRINSLSTGMTKETVINAMGEPNSVSVTGNTEFLHYKLSETADDAFYGFYTDYYVKIVGGTVESFGRLGDFDTTKDPTFNINTTNKDASTNGTDKMYEELIKLKQLLDDEIITKEEFDKKKKEIIDRY